MTVYGLDLDKVHHAIRATLVERVLPEVSSGDARAELMSVVEMLDSLQERSAWGAEQLSEAVARSHALESAVGGTPDAGASGVEALLASRRAIGDAVKVAYTDGIDPAVVAAVAEFSSHDVSAEISAGLRPGLPG